MGGRRILSDDQIDEMAALRERGWSCERIARHFTAAGTKISTGSIAWQCLRVGADVPVRMRGPLCQAAKPYRRPNGSIVRPFTAEEDAQLLAMEARGDRVNAIAKTLQRRENSIRGRLYTLARRDARREDAGEPPEPDPAQEALIRAKEVRARKLRRLPGQIEAARAKLARLEEMARA